MSFTTITHSALPTHTLSMYGVFTPTPACATQWTFQPSAINGVADMLVQSPQLEAGCLLPGLDRQDLVPTAVQIFSPGACPHGYTTAHSIDNGPVTTAICCASNFDYFTTTSTFHNGNKIARLSGCTSSGLPASDATTAYAEATALSEPVMMWDQPIIIAIEDSDRALFVRDVSDSSEVHKAPTQPTTKPIPTLHLSEDSSSSSSKKSKSSHSSWAIAGVVVAVIAGILIAGPGGKKNAKKATNAAPAGQTPNQTSNSASKQTTSSGSSSFGAASLFFFLLTGIPVPISSSSSNKDSAKAAKPAQAAPTAKPPKPGQKPPGKGSSAQTQAAMKSVKKPEKAYLGASADVIYSEKSPYFTDIEKNLSVTESELTPEVISEKQTKGNKKSAAVRTQNATPSSIRASAPVPSDPTITFPRRWKRGFWF